MLKMASQTGDRHVGNQQVDGPPDQLFRRIAKQRLHRPARDPDHPLRIDE